MEAAAGTESGAIGHSIITATIAEMKEELNKLTGLGFGPLGETLESVGIKGWFTREQIAEAEKDTPSERFRWWAMLQVARAAHSKGWQAGQRARGMPPLAVDFGTSRKVSSMPCKCGGGAAPVVNADGVVFTDQETCGPCADRAVLDRFAATSKGT